MEKTIIVTGGSKGIGKEIVIELARNNYNVILNYNKSEEEAKNIQKLLLNENKKINIFKADITKREEVNKLINWVINKFGKIDVLINNAGISQIKMFTDLTDDDWNNMIKTNLTSVFYMTQAVVPYMVHEKNGCIINISSVWGLVGASCEVHYSAAKAGVDGMTKSLAKELGLSNIRVNSIAPGDIDTDMNSSLTEEEINEIKQQTPLGKIGKPKDIAKCVKWLIEDEFTTGQVISPNGGWVI